MPKALYLHCSYGCDLWPVWENGPAAIVSNAPRYDRCDWVAFASRKATGATCRDSTRFGNALPTPAAVEIVTAHWRGAPAVRDGIRIAGGTGRAALAACIEAFSLGADLVIIPDVKATFPRWSIARAADEILTACLGGGTTFTEADMISRSVALYANRASFGHVDDERDPADWWKG